MPKGKWMLNRLKSRWAGGATVTLLGAAVLLGAFAPSARAEEAVAGVQGMDARFTHDVQPFMEAHCFKCHGNGKHKGDVVLDTFKDFATVLKDRKTWETVQEVLEKHEMPPKKEQQPAQHEIELFGKFVADVLSFGSGGP